VNSLVLPTLTSNADQLNELAITTLLRQITTSPNRRDDVARANLGAVSRAG